MQEIFNMAVYTAGTVLPMSPPDQVSGTSFVSVLLRVVTVVVLTILAIVIIRDYLKKRRA